MEVLDTGTLLARRAQLLEWIADVDMSIPELAMDVKFWREEIAKINNKLENGTNS